MTNNSNITLNEDRLELIGLSLFMIGIFITFFVWYIGLPILSVGLILFLFRDNIVDFETKMCRIDSEI